VTKSRLSVLAECLGLNCRRRHCYRSSW